MAKVFDDNKYYNDHELIKWYKRLSKRQGPKSLNKRRDMPIAWHPSRWWNWSMSEDEKKETEKLWK